MKTDLVTKTLGFLGSFAKAQEEFEAACGENEQLCEDIERKLASSGGIGDAFAKVGQNLQKAISEVMPNE